MAGTYSCHYWISYFPTYCHGRANAQRNNKCEWYSNCSADTLTISYTLQPLLSLSDQTKSWPTTVALALLGPVRKFDSPTSNPIDQRTLFLTYPRGILYKCPYYAYSPPCDWGTILPGSALLCNLRYPYFKFKNKTNFIVFAVKTPPITCENKKIILIYLLVNFCSLNFSTLSPSQCNKKI